MLSSGRPLPVFAPATSPTMSPFSKSTTYLAKIAVILQDAPDKRLTFNQLIYRLAPLLPHDRKSVEGNIRVCLSSNKCFVKIPLTPGSKDSKKNYWKLDTHQITEKMVRRHFRGILELFPELASKLKTQSGPSKKRPAHCPSESAACKTRVKCEVKFSSPFSIESLLKRDSPCARRTPRAPPLPSVPFRAEQQPQLLHRGVESKRSFTTWDSEEQGHSSGLSHMYPVGGSTHHELSAPGAAKVIKRMCVSCEPSFPMYTRSSAGPYFSSPHISYITYSTQGHTFTNHVIL